MKIAVIGGGAAGFFSAINIAINKPEVSITIFEKTNQFLAKVKVSGGGRCNVTNAISEPSPLAANYPRGEKELKQIFRCFSSKDTVNWFENLGLKLKTEEDGRIFPTSDSSQSVIDVFYDLVEKYNIELKRNKNLLKIEPKGDSFLLIFGDEEAVFDKVVISTGGHNNMSAYQFIESLGHSIENPIPSLFTFNANEKTLVDLSGVSVQNAIVKIETTKFSEFGPLLITHVGFSGPAIIKLSAWAAKYLFEQNYSFDILINWIGLAKEQEVLDLLESFKLKNPLKKVINSNPENIPSRLWIRLCEQSLIEENKIWAELTHKQRNKLLENLFRYRVHVKSKTTFKEEFVTCGGVPLQEINLQTMESKITKGVYFAGEVLNIDGITGGFNFQSAWSTGFLVGKNIA